MAKTFNLTPLRLRALRMIHQHPGMVAAKLADLCETHDTSWSKDFNGFKKMNGSQAATRWGARYAQPLIEQGLVDATHNYYGWAKLKLTKKGREVAQSGQMPLDKKKGLVSG